MFGVDIERDLVRLVGPEVALIVAPTRGLIPDSGADCSLRSQTKPADVRRGWDHRSGRCGS